MKSNNNSTYIYIFILFNLFIFLMSLSSQLFAADNAMHDKTTTSQSQSQYQPHRHAQLQWHLDNVDIHLVVQQMAKLTGKQFILDPRVQGKIQLYAPQASSEAEIYQLFLSALSILGYTTQTQDNQVHIIPETDAAKSAHMHAHANISLRVIPLHYIQTNDFISTVKPMLPNWIQLSTFPGSNHLLYAGDQTTLNDLQTLISRTDTKPQQILVQAMIAQVDTDAMKQLGIHWGVLAADALNLNHANPYHFQSGTMVLREGAYHSIQAVLQSLAQHQRADILAQPVVLTLNRQTAQIEMGQRVSIQQSSVDLPTLSAEHHPYNTYARENVSLSLQVTPTIHATGQIELKIEHQNNSLVNPQDPGMNPQVNVSRLQTQVMVKSDELVILGGIMQNQQHEHTSKLPVLGDLPIIGRLFQMRSTLQKKKVLLIFLKPNILS